MKAVVYHQYGSPDVLQLEEVPKPIARDNELLISVHASTVNRTDCGFLTGKPLAARLFYGLLKPKHRTLGNEFAGVVEFIGRDVTSFQPGDRVFGYNDKTFGGHAEFLVMEEHEAVTKMPIGLTFEEAAPITEGAHYALCDIRAAKIQKGQKVLINGATGAIGSAAVQLSNYFGADVTAICDTKNLALVKSLGASVVIDYTKQDFTTMEHTFDMVFDAVGKSSFAKCKPILKANGIYMSTELGNHSQNPFLALITPFLWGKKVLFPIPTINKSDVNFLKERIETGAYKPVIDRSYPLEQVAEAYRYVQKGFKTGNVVITIKP